MTREQKQGKKEKVCDEGENIVVAVKASKEIPKTALMWALTHVVQPGDCIILLVVVSSQSSGRKLWGFPRFAGDCAIGHRIFYSGSSSEQRSCIASYTTLLPPILQKNVEIKLVSGSPSGAVATEVKRAQASWVVLDKNLKNEEKRCIEGLQCNIVVMKRSQPKVLRLNLVGSPTKIPDITSEDSKNNCKKPKDSLNSILDPASTPSSSPELGTPFTATEAGTSSVSSSDPGTSPLFLSEVNGDPKKEEPIVINKNQELDEISSDSDSQENLSSSSSSLRFQPLQTESLRSHHEPQMSTTKALLQKFSKLDREAGIGKSSRRNGLEFSGNVRKAVSLSRNVPLGPPPLCSLCQHKAPVFGQPPKWFTYAELELATGGFSQVNFLAEGGYGSVHRGVLPDGRVVAVKQHKLASSQGDHEFCSEVEVLSCAQHRNVVMLIGFCIEDKRRLLVYEYICNGSLDSHLYGRQSETLEWSARQKIAVGSARGLRYLHEECRVGCIVHRDMRPNNILITHDFEPLVGDFGLARWQPDGDMGVETRVIGTFGYLAPEYAQSGQITEKADVYSFGVVLVELITGRKAVDLNRPKGQQCLTEWARPLLEDFATDKLMDPRLGNSYSQHEVYSMLHAASLCIRRDPSARPRMSQVLRILEGDMVLDAISVSALGDDVGSKRGRILAEQQHRYSRSLPDETLERFNAKLSLDGLRSTTKWGRKS